MMMQDGVGIDSVLEYKSILLHAEETGKRVDTSVSFLGWAVDMGMHARALTATVHTPLQECAAQAEC